MQEFVFFRGKVRLKQPKGHRLSIAEILFLANVKGIKRKSKVVDLGAGFGTLSILTALRHRCEVWAVERDPLMLELLEENVRANGLESLVRVVEGDVREVERFMKKGEFDAVLLNPPFYPQSYKGKNTFHFEKDTTLKDFIKATKYLLRDGGKTNLLFTALRCLEAVSLLVENNIHPLSLRFFYPKASKNAKLFSLYGVKNVKGTLTIEKPLIINKEDGSYTEEVKEILENFLSLS